MNDKDRNEIASVRLRIEFLKFIQANMEKDPNNLDFILFFTGYSNKENSDINFLSSLGGTKKSIEKAVMEAANQLLGADPSFAIRLLDSIVAAVVDSKDLDADFNNPKVSKYIEDVLERARAKQNPPT